MPDCCALRIMIRREDLYAFGKAAGMGGAPWWDKCDETENPAVVDCRIERVERGWQRQRKAAAEAGVTFLGSHSEGFDYAGMSFAACGGEMLESTVDGEGLLALQAERDLEIVADWDELKKFVELEKRAERELGIRRTDKEAEDA
jgi:hypothetical protein